MIRNSISGASQASVILITRAKKFIIESLSQSWGPSRLTSSSLASSTSMSTRLYSNSIYISEPLCSSSLLISMTSSFSSFNSVKNSVKVRYTFFGGVALHLSSSCCRHMWLQSDNSWADLMWLLWREGACFNFWVFAFCFGFFLGRGSNRYSNCGILLVFAFFVLFFFFWSILISMACLLRSTC